MQPKLRILLSTTAALIAASLFALPAAHAQVKLRYAHVGVANAPQTLYADEVAKLIKERTNGRVEVQVFPNSQLGGVGEMVDGVKSGAISMGHHDFASLGKIVPNTAVFNTPFVYRDPGHSLRATDARTSPALKEINAQLVDKGNMRIIGSFFQGTRELTSKEKVLSPKDMAGKKYRGVPVKLWSSMITGMGAVATPVEVSELATAGLPSIGLRVPQHIATLEIISRVGRPIAAPSANPSEQLSPTTAAHVAAGLGSRIDLIIDGGACSAGLESTIIAPGEDAAVLLRPGALARSDIELFTGPLGSPETASGILAPGMMKRHYAPRARLRLDAMSAVEGEAYLAFGAPPAGVSPTLNLSIRGDLAEAASNLFAMLRALDQSHDSIAVAPIPETGLGEAINDRLRRGAAL